MVILFLLGGLQGFIGWFMVKSGLVPQKYFVGHVELTTHFIAALGLLGYTLWFALSLIIKEQQKIVDTKLKNFLLLILVVLFLQLIYGGFMAGLRAAVIAPTWPTINGSMFPPDMLGDGGLANNPVTVHFIHRSIAYLLVILITGWFIYSRRVMGNIFFSRLRFAILLLVLVQASLGILTVLTATKPGSLVVFGAAHQFVAMVLVMAMVCLLFIVRKKRQIAA